MKKTLIQFIAGATLLALASSCSVTLPVAVSNAPVGSKKGESKSVVLFGTLYLNSKYGVKEAANNGKITSAIATIDEETSWVLPIIMNKKLIVTAE